MKYLIIISIACVIAGCTSFEPSTLSWQPVSPSFVGADVVRAVQYHEKNAPLRIGNPKWVWEDAILFENDTGHYLVRVYYVSPLRGKIWTWFEVDNKLQLVASGGFQEG